jgi:hypothetical protein
MPKVDLTYQQILEAVKQLTFQEQQKLRVDLHSYPLSLKSPAFTADDPLWNVIGIGKGTGEAVARHHDAYLYRKDDRKDD